MAETVNLEHEAREHAALLQRIMDANVDLAERLNTLGLSMDYDVEDDALYVNIGPPTEAATESVYGELYVRVEPDTLKIVGLECWDFIKAPALGVFPMLLLYALQAVARKRSRRPVHVPEEVQERLANEIRELLVA